MANLIILNSNITIVITLQNWPVDTLGPFSDALVKKGFTVNRPTAIQQMQVQSGPFAAKGTTTGIGIDYGTRRINMQITNNITDPNENIQEIFSALKSIGYPEEESIERIDIQGSITIKTDGDKASTYVPNAIKQEFVDKTKKVFNRDINVLGIRLSTKEPVGIDVTKSPFLILIEPLFNDPSNTKLLAILNYSSSDGSNTLEFLKSLYDNLKNVILGLKGV